MRVATIVNNNLEFDRNNLTLMTLIKKASNTYFNGSMNDFTIAKKIFSPVKVFILFIKNIFMIGTH